MENNHKLIKTRKQYNNLKSYDDELAIVLLLLKYAEQVEKDITKDLEEALYELCDLYNDIFPFYYVNGVLNKEEFQKLLLSLTTGKGGIDSKVKAVTAAIEQKTRELQNRKLMAWLILDYELTSKKTAKSIGVDYKQFMRLASSQNKQDIVLQPWCKDGKSVLDRIKDNTQDMELKLRAVILEGIEKGWTLDRMTEKFRTITGIAASKAARLIRTETMAVYSKATRDMFLENGIEYVEIIGDAVCGGICLDYVGGAIPLREAQIGDDLPPYHPNCACSFCSYTEFDDERIGFYLEKQDIFVQDIYKIF